MSLYPINYFDDKDYTMPEIAIFHSHYPNINIQYEEISFRITDNNSGVEFQLIDCTSNYLMFVLTTIWRHIFGGSSIEYEEAKEAEEHEKWLEWHEKIWDAINEEKNKINIRELFEDILQNESYGWLENLYYTYIKPYLDETNKDNN